MTHQTQEAGHAIHDLVSRALDYGIQNASPDGPVVPFVLAQVDDAFQLHRIVLGDVIDGGASMPKAREVATAIDGIDRAAYAWDGYVRLDGERTDAILVLAQERGEDGAFIVCQPYAFEGGEATASGDVVLLSQDEDPLIDLPRAISPHLDDWTPPPKPGPGPTSALRERLQRHRDDESE